MKEMIMKRCLYCYELLENQESNYHSIIGNDKCEGLKKLDSN